MRALIDKSLGYVTVPQPVNLVDDAGNVVKGEASSGKLTVDAVRYLHGLLQALAFAINGKLNFGDGSQASKAGNIDGQWISVLTPAVANTEFPVDHALGRIPAAVLVALSDVQSTIIVSSLGSWSRSRIFLKCSAASVTLRLLLL